MDAAKSDICNKRNGRGNARRSTPLVTLLYSKKEPFTNIQYSIHANNVQWKGILLCTRVYANNAMYIAWYKQ